MELEGYGLVANAIELALDIRREVNAHPLISKYFKVLTAPTWSRKSTARPGFVDFLAHGLTWTRSAACTRTSSASTRPA